MQNRIRIAIGILCFWLMIIPTAFAQPSQKMDISLKNKTLKDLIYEIEKETSYTFLYSNINVDIPINIELKGKSVSEILDTSLNTHDIS